MTNYSRPALPIGPQGPVSRPPRVPIDNEIMRTPADVLRVSDLKNDDGKKEMYFQSYSESDHINIFVAAFSKVTVDSPVANLMSGGRSQLSDGSNPQTSPGCFYVTFSISPRGARHSALLRITKIGRATTSGQHPRTYLPCRKAQMRHKPPQALAQPPSTHHPSKCQSHRFIVPREPPGECRRQSPHTVPSGSPFCVLNWYSIGPTEHPVNPPECSPGHGLLRMGTNSVPQLTVHKALQHRVVRASSVRRVCHMYVLVWYTYVWCM